MKLFEMKNWQLIVSEEAWGLLPFTKILKRDKSKDKEVAMKEMLFVFFFADIRSNYLDMPLDIREREIAGDIGLPEKWKKDEVIDIAIDFYKERSQSVIQKLYEDTLISTQAIGAYLRNTELLLEERDNNGKPVIDIAKITAANQKIPTLMKLLKSAYHEVIKEQEDLDNKKKGARSFNTFEDGLEI